MAFLEKKEPTVINIKLTSKGREELSKGKLKFSKYVVGDSEIDYRLIRDNNLEPTNIGILKAKDKNSDIITYLKKDENSEKYNNISSVISNTSVITNTAKEYGFFIYDTEKSTYKIITEPTHVKQPDVIIKRNEIDGSKVLKLYQSTGYTAIVDEPLAGDFILIKFDNNSDYIDKLNSRPYLFFKIQSIKSGSLVNNNLEVIVDRNLPSFSNDGGGIEYRVIVYPNSLDYIYYTSCSVDYVSEEVLSFMSNIQQPSKEIPIWNLDVVFSEEIIGTTLENKLLKSLPSSTYSSFVSFIQKHNRKYEKLGLIHYSNQLPSNIYGEGFFSNTSILNLPTIGWHKSQTNEIGLKLSCLGGKQVIEGLELEYYDLADENDHIVGKVFNTLKMFVIEDQELLFAISYKSNRSWTIPQPIINNIQLDNCVPLPPECLLSGITTSVDANRNEETGEIIVNGLVNNHGDVLLELYEDGNNSPVNIGLIKSGDTIYSFNVEPSTYKVVFTDIKYSECKFISEDIILKKCSFSYDISHTDEVSMAGGGTITVGNINNNYGNILVEVKDSSTLNVVDSSTLNNITTEHTFNLDEGSYVVELSDLDININCVESENITIYEYNSCLSYDVVTTDTSGTTLGSIELINIDGNNTNDVYVLSIVGENNNTYNINELVDTYNSNPKYDVGADNYIITLTDENDSSCSVVRIGTVN